SIGSILGGSGREEFWFCSRMWPRRRPRWQKKENRGARIRARTARLGPIGHVTARSRCRRAAHRLPRRTKVLHASRARGVQVARREVDASPMARLRSVFVLASVLASAPASALPPELVPVGAPGNAGDPGGS